ncbi:hypothetical protein DH2020_009848 [Rehmannia glutinosa]|uniref:Uncharacterized protein n=1 Tax=Rehmannia glutinosa TaxID=99300 RepID=A0ABR0X826_REHGL
MGRTYDNWGRLVEVVIRREQIRNLCLSDSISSFDSDLSSTSSSNWQTLAKSVNAGKRIGNKKVRIRRRNAMWKGLSIFGGFSSKKDYSEEEKELKPAKYEKTLHGLEPMKYEKVFRTADEAKRRAEIARLQELGTLKGQITQIASLVKARGLDISSINYYYSWSSGNYYA